MFYLLAVLINLTNFKPVVVKSCVEYPENNAAKIELEKAVVEMKNAGLSCEKSTDTLVYNCQNPKSGVIGKVLLMKDKKECKTFPDNLAQNLKTLTGK